MLKTALWFLTLVVMSAPALAAEKADSSSERLWQLAAEAYQSGQIETGHSHLRALVDESSGDVDLAIKSLEEILTQARRHGANRLANQYHLSFVENPSAQYAARRLCELERIGAVSAGRKSVKDAFTVLVDHNVRHGRLIETMELIDRFVQQNPHDPFWRIEQARAYRKLDSSKTRPLFDRLKAEMDLDHPDVTVREHWIAFSKELEEVGDKLPQQIQPLPKGSPLPLMEPDDPDGEWGLVADRPARKNPAIVDRLAAKALALNQIVPWRDASGLTDPARALDLHLLSQPPAELEPLRRLQAERFAQEAIGASAPDAQILAMSRRYAWAPAAQRRLQIMANRMLFAGRAQFALRSFRDLLEHAADEKLRDEAQVGYWTARVQIAKPSSVEELLGKVAPDRVFSWFGKPTQASDICRQLIERRAQPTAPVASAATLKGLVQHVVRIPPISPWSGDQPGAVDLAVVDRDLLVSGRNILAMYNPQKLDQPVWSSSQPPHFGESKHLSSHPGYFRPQFDKGQLYTRWGFSSLPPHGIAGVDRRTGESLWSSKRPPSTPRARSVPLSDPVLADGLLYYLQLSSASDINQGRGRRLSLMCFDPWRRQPAWESTIATGGHPADVNGSLERANSATAIYGNRVTIHDGAVYSNSNCGIVARSDVRDGRTDWIHCYRPVSVAGRSVRLNHGSPPIIAGNKVICMPKDAGRVFALDQSTGRLIWDNPMVLGVQIVGAIEDLLIVRGQFNVAGLDLATGDVRWYRPTGGRVLGRARLFGSSICIAKLEGLLRLDAKTGHVEELQLWGMGDEKPLNFTIHGRDLYVVTNKPGEDPGREIGRPLNLAVPEKPPPLALPLARAWLLPRNNAKITLPPKDSPLHGTAFVTSEGILEQIDLSARGRIRWQRFVETGNPRIHFIGKTLLVVDHAGGRAAGQINRAVALDATNGRTLWEHNIDTPVQATLNCGATQVFHDAIGRIVAVDLATGRRAWQRYLGDGFQMRISWNGERLHVFFVSRLRAAYHLVLDAQSGRTLSENTITAKTSADAKNAQRIKGGYYEVSIKPVRARYVRLVALSEVNGRGWTSISELHVIGKDGKNVSRRGWMVTADSSETKAAYDTSPRTIFDDDPVTWWHTQWMGGIPPHPHEVGIDMGTQQTVTGIRYLPAVIVNNNGMIRDYELYVSQDGKNWGDPVAKGFLVNRTKVDQAFASKSAIVFESRASANKPLGIFRYPLDGSAALMVQENARIVHLREPYYFTAASKNGAEVLVVHRFDDAKYRFELGPSKQFDTSFIEIENDRLVLGRKGILVADLVKKRFIIAPSDEKLKHNQEGLVLREGADSLLKIVPQGKQGQVVFRFELRTGQKTEFVLSQQTDPFQPGHNGQDRSIPRFDGLVLLNDNSAVTAWIGGGP